MGQRRTLLDGNWHGSTSTTRWRHGRIRFCRQGFYLSLDPFHHSYQASRPLLREMKWAYQACLPAHGIRLGGQVALLLCVSPVCMHTRPMRAAEGPFPAPRRTGVPCSACICGRQMWKAWCDALHKINRSFRGGSGCVPAYGAQCNTPV